MLIIAYMLFGSADRPLLNGGWDKIVSLRITSSDESGEPGTDE